MKISQMVYELQSGHDFVTRRTDDPGKNNMSPNPKVGRHKYSYPTSFGQVPVLVIFVLKC